MERFLFEPGAGAPGYVLRPWHMPGWGAWPAASAAGSKVCPERGRRGALPRQAHTNKKNPSGPGDCSPARGGAGPEGGQFLSSSDPYGNPTPRANQAENSLASRRRRRTDANPLRQKDLRRPVADSGPWRPPSDRKRPARPVAAHNSFPKNDLVVSRPFRREIPLIPTGRSPKTAPEFQVARRP